MDLTDDYFRILVESIQDYAIYLLAPDGTVQSWNAGAQRLKGYTAAEIVGTSFARFFSAADQAAGKPRVLLDEALRADRTEDFGWRIRKDGSQFWASAVITALRDAAGRHIGFAKVTRDLTDRSYRAFVETSHAIVWTTDASGTPNADSQSWRELTGQTEDEWRSPRRWDAIHPADHATLRAAWQGAREAATRFDTEYRLRRRDGQYVWMAVSAIPFVNPDGRVREWFGVMTNIADRKRAEQEREHALHLWFTTLRSIGDAVIATDAPGNVTFMNPIAERLTGWRLDEATGRRLHEVFPIFNEDSGAAVEDPVDKVLREGVAVGLANHTVLRRRDGTELPIDDSAAPIHTADGAILGVVLVFRDAAEVKRDRLRRQLLGTAIEQLLEAADHREALKRIAGLMVPQLADWASVAIAEPGTTRSQQIAFAHVDPAKVEFARELARRYPPDPDAAVGVPSVLRTGRAALYRDIPGAVLETAAVDAEHLRMLRELDLRSALIVPLRGKGHVLGALTLIYAGSDRRYDERDLAFAEDLGHRAGLIIERRKAEEEAEIANRMKDEFLAMMSHELRTPLQAIVGYASMLERGLVRDPAKAIGAIMRNAMAQTRLVEDILDVSRIASGKLRLAMARIDLASAIRGAVEAVRPAAAARRIQLVETIPLDLGDIHADSDRLQQIVWNLVSNAVKFTEPGGVVEIEAQRSGSSARVLVKDTGRGIAPEHLSAIFERFRQLESSATRQHGGLGLGLAIVRYLVEAHGGTVEAKSGGLGKGSTFIVTLPAVVPVIAPEPGGAGHARQREAMPLRGIRVLLVEDDHDAREMLGDALVEQGATIEPAASAAEAFAAVLREPPHVVVSDIGMPIEDGYSLIRRIRALAPEQGGDVPAIALTAYARPEDAKHAEEAGFQVHLAKPVRFEQLIDAVRSFLG